MAALSHVRRIVEAHRHGLPLPAESVAWLAEGLTKYHQAACSLEEALGLKSESGQYRASTRLLLLERNQQLRRAWLAQQSMTPWQRSQELAKSIRRFQSGKWRRWRELDAPPRDCGEKLRGLFYAFKTGRPIPQTARQLHRICLTLGPPPNVTSNS